MMPITIKKVLIANRGGVVSRINFTCQALGIKTVAIFGLQDASSPYIFNTDQAYQINKNGYDAYLDQDAIIKIALESGADAIHPGYGFLSENYNFAQKVIDSNLCWIGPLPQTIKLMGDKNTARYCAELAGIPVIPGAELKIDESLDIALQTAKQVGFPLILKDPLGGGGKAARRVDSIDGFQSALKLTILEAQKFTGTTTILLERYLVNPRHIEVQIAGDGTNFVHLFERECSIQRRYQKIIEEAPCNFVSQQTLEKMYKAAILLGKAVKYKGIGTIEFMVTPQDEFFFLEMNTRLQVEHSVTEITTGIDLVAMQLFIAENNKLPLLQNQIIRHGHAIECRIYSEDPAQNFMPCVGKIQKLQIPSGLNIRFDHDLENGKEITSFFDPMQAQLTVHGENREAVINYMRQALKKLQIDGITTNTNFLFDLIGTNEFKLGKFDTQFLTNEIIEKICLANSVKNISELDVIFDFIMQHLHNRNLPKVKNRVHHAAAGWRAQQWN